MKANQKQLSLNLNKILVSVSLGKDLSKADCSFMFNHIMNGNVSDVQIAGFLMGLAVKGETIEELIASTNVLRKKSIKINSPRNTIDTCGTGGDSKGSLNISTAVAIVAASCEVNVAKHGNRAVSSKSGSSDVLTALGVNINAGLKKVEESLFKLGLCFLAAPLYHSSMKNVAKVRSQLGIRTIFNLLGPLINPANAKKQLIGVYDNKWLMPVAKCLKELGSEKVWVVHGCDGMDEITVTGNTNIVELNYGKVNKMSINPSELGINISKEGQLKGGSADENAAAMIDLFKGAEGSYRDIVVLNTAASLVVAEKCETLVQGIIIAKEAIDTGKSLNKLDLFIKLSKES